MNLHFHEGNCVLYSCTEQGSVCRSPGVNLKDGSQGACSGVSAGVALGDVVVLLLSVQRRSYRPPSLCQGILVRQKRWESLGCVFFSAPESFRKSARSARTCHCQSLLQAVTIVDTAK